MKFKIILHEKIKTAFFSFLVAVGYYLSAKAGLVLSSKPDFIAALWPPNGVLLAILLLSKPKNHPWYLLATIPAELFADMPMGMSWQMSVFFVLSDWVEVLTASFMIRHFSQSSDLFISLKSLLLYFFCCVLFAPFVAAFLGGAISFFPQSDGIGYLMAFRRWFVSDALTHLLVTPTIYLSVKSLDFEKLKENRRRLLHVAGTGLILFMLGFYPSDNMWTSTFNIPALVPLIAYAPFPFLLFSAIRFGLKETFLLSLLTSIIFIWHASEGHGPFVYQKGFDGIFILQLYLFISITPLLLLSMLIEENRKTNTDLGKSRERLQMALKGAELGMWDWDIQTGTTHFNDLYFTMLGYAPDELPHHYSTWRQLLHPEDIERVLKELQHAIEKQIPWNLEFRMQVKSGGFKWLLGSGKIVEFDKEGKPLRAAGIHLDITEKKSLEEERQKIKKLESVGLLAGGIAHDFNNILAAILGNINLASFDTKLTEDTKKLLAEAEKASLRAKDLTQQLLTFSRGGDPVQETASLERVIMDSANFVLRGDKVACQYNIPDNLWLVDIDKGQISQVIQNVVLNASHSMPEGGIVTITCDNVTPINGGGLIFAPDQRYVKIRIQDTGIGIPQSMLDKIFDPYFSTKAKGSGLGLAITQSIISRHNGHISVESSPGKGSRFTIYLPASDKMSVPKQKHLEETGPSSQAKILIMDDDDMVSDVAKEMLIRLGHKVTLSTNGKDAIHLYQESMKSGERFDLVIMDLTIPGGLGGKEAVEKVLKLDSKARVIVSSGYSNDPIMANFQKYGFRAAIAKPFQFQDLSRVIGQVLD